MRPIGAARERAARTPQAERPAAVARPARRRSEMAVAQRARQLGRGGARGGAAAGGFTLVEMSIAVVIIGVLAALGLVAGGKLIREARVTTERHFLASLKTGVEQFKQQFGFLPPLICDGPPTTNSPGPLIQTNYGRAPAVRDDAFLKYESNYDQPRWSEYSLSYYLIGLLDVDSGYSGPGGPKPVDGVSGPGFTEPQRDGTFLQRGPTIPPYVDPARGRNRVYRDPAAPEKVALLDRWGNRIRYYRWLPRYATSGANKGEVEQYMVPRAVGDPNTDPELRGATFAIVSLGPDNQTDERRPLPTAGRSDGRVDASPRDDTTKDDIVEVGR